jgi:hypothetical protein
MKLTLIILLTSLLLACDYSTNYSDTTISTYTHDNIMTVHVSVANKLTKFKCIESQSGTCFFKISSKNCTSKINPIICTTLAVDNFKLAPGMTREFEGKNNKEKFLQCSSPLNFKDGDVCIPT